MALSAGLGPARHDATGPITSQEEDDKVRSTYEQGANHEIKYGHTANEPSWNGSGDLASLKRPLKYLLIRAGLIKPTCASVSTGRGSLRRVLLPVKPVEPDKR